METKFKAFADFIAEYEVDLSYYYSVRIDFQKVWLQGFHNKVPLLLGAKFTNPSINEDGYLSFDFEYNGVAFQIYLT